MDNKTLTGDHLHDVHHLKPKAIAERISAAKTQCQSQGVRFTVLRQQVYELILKAHRPIGAYDLITELQQARHNQKQSESTDKDKASKNVAPPTVYRSLEFLLQQGLIHQLTSMNAYIPCCHPRSQHNAAFFICEVCERVQECSSLPVQEVLTYAKEDVGFIVSQSVIEMRGTCQACQAS
ncbi:MAG: transcriptional repressor [Psychrobacter sp.]|nr:transcriptional repressor [Psychrobacter sp.]